MTRTPPRRPLRYAAGYTHADFVRRIAENPKDATPSLVYADWLEEHAMPTFAGVVRHHVARGGGSQGPHTWVRSPEESGGRKPFIPIGYSEPHESGPNGTYLVHVDQSLPADKGEEVHGHYFSQIVPDAAAATEMMNRLKAEGVSVVRRPDRLSRLGRPARYAASVSPARPWTHLSGEKGFEHDYSDDRGNNGVVRVLPRNGGDMLHVDWIGPRGVSPGEVAHTSGAGNVRGVFDQLFAHYPGAKFVSGIRTGGAFAGKPTRIVRGIPGRLERRPLKYAKVDGDVKAHSLIAGFPLEHFLRHLANDPANSGNVRDLSKVALTGGEKGPDGPGAPEALWMLADALDEHENADGTSRHPLRNHYNLRSAADKIVLDSHTHTALREAGERLRTGQPHTNYSGAAEPVHFSPEYHAVLAENALNGARNPYQRHVLDEVRNRVSQLAPGADRKMIDESIRRHGARASIKWAKDTKSYGGEKNRLIRRSLADLTQEPAENLDTRNREKATRYRRPRRYGRANIEAALRAAHEGTHHVPLGIFNDMLQDEGGIGQAIALTATDRGVSHDNAAAGYLTAPELTHALLASRQPADPSYTAVWRGTTRPQIGMMSTASRDSDSSIEIMPHRYYPLNHLFVRYRPNHHTSVSGHLSPRELYAALPTIPEPHRTAVEQWFGANIPEAAAEHARHVARERPELKSRGGRSGGGDLMAWLDTNGGFHGVKTHGTHEAWADANGTTKADLQAAGWMRVTPGGSTLWAANPHRGPNERQKSALVDAAMEHGFDNLSHDNDRAERVLWSNTERLNRGRRRRYALNARGDFIDSLRRVRSRQQQALRKSAEQIMTRILPLNAG